MKVVVVSHGDYASGMLSATQMVIGEHENVYSLGLNPGEGIESFLEKVKQVAEDVSDDNQLIFLCDLLGGTPFNVCSVVSKDNKNIKVVYGTNLPILIEAIMQREMMNVDELSEYLLQNVSSMIGIGEM